MSNNKSINSEGVQYDHLVNKIVRFTHWNGVEEDYLIKKNDKDGRKLEVLNIDGTEKGVLTYENIGPRQAVNKIEVIRSE